MSGVYHNAIDHFNGGDMDWVNDSFAIVAVDADLYTVDLVNDDNIGDIPASAILSETTLTGRYIADRTLYCDSAVFPSVADTGQVVSALVVFKNSRIVQESKLIAYMDDAPELPVTPNGDDITVNFEPTGLISFQGA